MLPGPAKAPSETPRESVEEDGRTVHGIALAWRQSDDLGEAGIAKTRTCAVASFLSMAREGTSASTGTLSSSSMKLGSSGRGSSTTFLRCRGTPAFSW